MLTLQGMIVMDPTSESGVMCITATPHYSKSFKRLYIKPLITVQLSGINVQWQDRQYYKLPSHTELCQHHISGLVALTCWNPHLCRQPWMMQPWLP